MKQSTLKLIQGGKNPAVTPPLKDGARNETSCEQVASQSLINSQCARAVSALFADAPQADLAFVDMIETAQLGIEQLMSDVGRGLVELLLQASAQRVAGIKRARAKSDNGVRWYGTQATTVSIGEAKIRVNKPRLRDAQHELEIPAHTALKSDSKLQQGVEGQV